MKCNSQKKAAPFIAALGIIVVSALAGFGQKPEAKTEGPGITAAANNQTVDARQSGTWTVGVDPAKNTVQVGNTAANPLPVSVVAGPARRPYQLRAIINSTGNGFQTVFLPIPAGKRLVIENISAIARVPQGYRMEMNLFSYYDNDGDGVGGIEDIVFHRIALEDQGLFDTTQIFSANHKVLIFADELIGTTQYQLAFQARLNAVSTVSGQGQVTISGYVEDIR